MKRIILSALYMIFVTILIVTGLSGCVIIGFSDISSVTAKGDPENYEFNVGEYNAIKVETLCDIRYFNNSGGASSNTVTLSVSPNTLEYYKVEVINGELVVRTTKRVNFRSDNSPVLTVSTPVLTRLTIEGAGAFTAYDKITAPSLAFIIKGAGSGKAELEVESLYVELSGAGNMELSGKADTANLNLSGAGDLDALALRTNDAAINLSGAGKVSVNCSHNLRINANGMGTIEYRGSPSLILNKDGMVRITQLN